MNFGKWLKNTKLRLPNWTVARFRTLVRRQRDWLALTRVRQTWNNCRRSVACEKGEDQRGLSLARPNRPPGQL